MEFHGNKSVVPKALPCVSVFSVVQKICGNLLSSVDQKTQNLDCPNLIKYCYKIGLPNFS